MICMVVMWEVRWGEGGPKYCLVAAVLLGHSTAQSSVEVSSEQLHLLCCTTVSLPRESVGEISVGTERRGKHGEWRVESVPQ